MKIRLLFLLLLAIAICACSTTHPQSESNSQITSYEAPGNLQSTHDVGCVSAADVSNTYTPSDLYPAVVKCVQNKHYKKAIFLFGLAGVYTRFDEQRVADKTSHDVMSVYMYRLGDTFSDAQKKKFFQTLEAIIKDPQKLKANCDQIRKIGPPDYYPRYMIQHGMGAFNGESSPKGLVQGFQPAKAWELALNTYLHCPPASEGGN